MIINYQQYVLLDTIQRLEGATRYDLVKEFTKNDEYFILFGGDPTRSSGYLRDQSIQMMCVSLVKDKLLERYISESYLPPYNEYFKITEFGHKIWLEYWTQIYLPKETLRYSELGSKVSEEANKIALDANREARKSNTISIVAIVLSLISIFLVIVELALK